MKRFRSEGIDEIKPIDYLQMEIKERTIKLQEEIDKRAERQNELRWQRYLLLVLSIEFGLAIIFSGVIIVFQGFSIYGFNLGENIIYLLAASTFGAIVGLLTILVKYIFDSRQK